MIARNLQVDIDDVEPGMVLSATLSDAHGGVLLPAGVELTESILTSLRRRGIEEVTVINDKISDAELAAERQRLQERLDRLFRKSSTAGANKALQESIMRYRLGDGK
jgi:hypothetical protein